jgi:hypothetical protein
LAEIAGADRHGRNTTRVVCDSRMLALNEVTVSRQPLAANNNEYQATDTYNEYGRQHPLLAYNNPEGVEWHDMGKVPGLLAVRGILRGLADTEHPIWYPAATAA